MTAADILPLVRTKFISDAVTEADRLIAVEEIEQTILNYCHITEIPPALKFTWANMAVDLLTYQHAANTPAATSGGDGAETAGAVSSIKEGDTTVSFGGKSSNAADRDRALDTHKATLDNLVMDYTAQLQKYRKVAW